MPASQSALRDLLVLLRRDCAGRAADGWRRGPGRATAFAIVEAAGKSTLVLFLEDPNALKRSHESDFERLSGVWHLLGKEVASVPEEYEPLQAPNDGFT